MATVASTAVLTWARVQALEKQQAAADAERDSLAQRLSLVEGTLGGLREWRAETKAYVLELEKWRSAQEAARGESKAEHLDYDRRLEKLEARLFNGGSR